MSDTEIVIPQALAPFQRVWTDTVERPLDIFPFPNTTITSSNCSQIIRFDFPGNQFLDVVHRQMMLEFTLSVPLAGTTPAQVADYCGYLISTIRVFVNNELTEEILNVGQLNTLLQAMMATTDSQSNFAGESRGAKQSQFGVDYSLQPCGDITEATAAKLNVGFIGPIFNNTTQANLTTLLISGITFRIPIAPKGSFFAPPQGLIPLFRLPNVRIELTFNPKQYVLIAKGPTTKTAGGAAADSALQDYSISNMRISCMYAQSISLAKVYSEPEWLQSFWGYYFYTVNLQGTNNLLPIVTAFKSSRYIIGVLANPAQFTGDQAAVVGTTNTIIGGNTQYNTGQTTGILSDRNRFTYFYGCGGYGQGSAILACNTTNDGLTTGTTDSIFGRDAYVVPSALNFQQNNEWIYQQDLTTRTQFFEEILKVFPEVQHSCYFNTLNFPGIRGVIVINLQSPALKDQFICGNRAAEGQATSFVKLNFQRNPRDFVASGAVSLAGTYLQSVQLMCWICFDKTLRVNMESGLATVDS